MGFSASTVLSNHRPPPPQRAPSMLGADSSPRRPHPWRPAACALCLWTWTLCTLPINEALQYSDFVPGFTHSACPDHATWAHLSGRSSLLQPRGAPQLLVAAKRRSVWTGSMGSPHHRLAGSVLSPLWGHESIGAANAGGQVSVRTDFPLLRELSGSLMLSGMWDAVWRKWHLAQGRPPHRGPTVLLRSICWSVRP